MQSSTRKRGQTRANRGYFDNIIPCGIRGKAVTSLNVELGVEKVDEEEVKAKILKHFATLFEAEFMTS
jgi:lipoyl(octanoyl) transferase